jgi:hypothetical protein
MFSLIKIAAYALLGYALYEFFQGLVAQPSRERPWQPNRHELVEGVRRSIQDEIKNRHGNRPKYAPPVAGRTANTR